MPKWRKLVLWGGKINRKTISWAGKGGKEGIFLVLNLLKQFEIMHRVKLAITNLVLHEGGCHFLNFRREKCWSWQDALESRQRSIDGLNRKTENPLLISQPLTAQTWHPSCFKVARDSCDVTHSLKQASIHTSHVHASKTCTKYSLHLVQSASTHKCHNVVRSKVLIVRSRSVFMQDTA